MEIINIRIGALRDQLHVLKQIVDDGKQSFFDKTQVGVDANALYESINVLLDLFNNFTDDLPGDFANAQRIISERNKIIKDAKKEAEKIIKDHQEKASRLVLEHEITRKAKMDAEETALKAQHLSEQIQLGGIEYVDSVLINLEEVMSKMQDEFKGHTRDLRAFMSQTDVLLENSEKYFEETFHEIADNRNVLRDMMNNDKI